MILNFCPPGQSALYDIDGIFQGCIPDQGNGPSPIFLPPPSGNGSISILNGSETAFFSSLSTWVSSNLLPLLFVLAAVVIAVSMLLRYGKKTVSNDITFHSDGSHSSKKTTSYGRK